MVIKYLCIGLQGKTRVQRSKEHLCPIYVRLRDGKGLDLMRKTKILVKPEWWNNHFGRIVNSPGCSSELASEIQLEISKLNCFLIEKYVTDKAKGTVCPDWLDLALKKYYGETSAIGIDVLFDSYLANVELSAQRVKQYNVVRNGLHRYVKYRMATGVEDTIDSIKEFNGKFIMGFLAFLNNEHLIYPNFPSIYSSIPTQFLPVPRSRNTLIDVSKKLRTVFKWANSVNLTDNNPFESMPIPQEVYGTPICLSSQEVRRIWEIDFSRKRRLDEQRDIFVFQCNVGCRVGDLVRLMKYDVSDGVLSYIPCKTSKYRSNTVEVPLNAVAAQIVQKYVDNGEDRLLPFISPQRYNTAIRKVLKAAGIDRLVTVPDNLSQGTKKVRLYEIASSHLARRTFVNSVYRNVRDSSLVSSLSGHSEGSKAFARYRNIDIDVKRDMVNGIWTD